MSDVTAISTTSLQQISTTDVPDLPGKHSSTFDKVNGSKPKASTKVKSRARARPRRRVANSDAESDDDDSIGSDNSLTEHSASELSDDEEDEDAVEDAIDDDLSAQPDKPVFADVSSTTPAAWADEKFGSEEIGREVVEMSFEEFNRGGRGLPVRGRGGAATGEVRKKKEYTEEETRTTGEVRKKREYTEEETRRFEEMKARRKEKQKARRAESKAAKKIEKQNGQPQGPSKSSIHYVLTVAANPPAPPPVDSIPKAEATKGKVPKAKGKPRTDATVS